MWASGTEAVEFYMRWIADVFFFVDWSFQTSGLWWSLFIQLLRRIWNYLKPQKRVLVRMAVKSGALKPRASVEVTQLVYICELQSSA